ncbi:MAG: IS1634 family transposase [Candidatus Eisenbacteria bacterium]|nr:IS1634 family transposase [Candidatus Eisenbacteria bacterium]
MKTYPLAEPGHDVVYWSMFLRKFSIDKDGKRHDYWALVESVRTARGPRQRVVSYLGDMDEAGRLGIHHAVEKGLPTQESLFDETSPEWVEVNVRKVRTERSRRFGDVWLALELIKKLGVSELLDRVMLETSGSADAALGRHPKISWATLANVLVISRFCEPSSELHIAEQFYRKSALSDLLGIADEDIYDNRLYRALDKLLEHKDDIQKHLKGRLGELFHITYDILLYDVTSSYFEGQASRNPQAQQGYSRDSRPDCKQVCIGLVVTKEGIPLGYEVFEGNRHDSKTVETIIEKMESLYGKANRIWIMDRGMASPDNLELLQEEGRRYIIGTAKSQLKKFEHQLLTKGWKQVHEGLEVKLCPSPGGGEEIFILCRSEARREKERAIHNRFLERLDKGLHKVKKSCTSGRVKNVRVVERRIGRLLERYNRASPLFDIDVKELDGKLDLSWTIHNTYSDWARLSEGYYLLRTNIIDWTPEDLWKAYIQLTEAEAAFRIQKQDLKLRPIWHQREDRVQAHILVCFLAYVLWKCLAQMCKQAGLGNEPRTILEEIKNLTLIDVVLLTRTGTEIRLRCVSKPEQHLAILLQKLNLRPPPRLEMKLNL